MTDRNGRFPHEIKNARNITLESGRGDYDPSLKGDGRCPGECRNCEMGNYCLMTPAMALSSLEAWGDEILSAAGLPDGDMPNPDRLEIPLELIACNIYGQAFDQFDVDGSNQQESRSEEFFLLEAEAELLKEDDPDDWYDSLDSLYYEPEDTLGYFVTQRIVVEKEEIDDFRIDSDINLYPDAKAWVYDDEIDGLPSYQPGSRSVDIGKSKKEIRLFSTHHSCSCGKRGNDRYKAVRKGRDRKSKKVLRAIAEI